MTHGQQIRAYNRLLHRRSYDSKEGPPAPNDLFFSSRRHHCIAVSIRQVYASPTDPGLLFDPHMIFKRSSALLLLSTVHTYTDVSRDTGSTIISALTKLRIGRRGKKRRVVCVCQGLASTFIGMRKRY